MMLLTDVTPDCLELICEYLQLDDLLNIADANKCLRDVAATTYFRKYRHKKIILVEAKRMQFQYYYHQNIIEIEDLKTTLQLLRCFGDLISEILFYSRGDAYRNGQRVFPDLTCHTLNYVNEYCVKSLTAITFQERIENLTIHLTKPFTKIETVSFRHCVLPDSNTLAKLFPSMCKLTCAGFVDTSCIVNHFPNLEYLNVEIWLRHELATPKTDIKMLLQLNPQLKTLHISSPGIPRFTNPPLLAAILLDGTEESLQNLESLTINGTYFDESLYNGNAICLKNVRDLNIYLQGLSDEPLPMIPLVFEKLESFEIGSITNLDVEFYKFVEKHPNIKKLKINYTSSRHSQFQTKLAALLPSLVDIEITGGQFSTDEILRFSTDFKNLKKIDVNFRTDFNFDQFKARLNREWHASIVKGFRNQRIQLNRN